jgi:flagellar hook-basal body complex protein FliE
MRIDGFQPGTYSPQALRRTAQEQPAERAAGPGFGQQIKSAVDNVNSLQHNANDLAEKVASGETGDTHKAMIAMEHALMSLDFTLQVRNKVLEAYQEIMRTQI